MPKCKNCGSEHAVRNGKVRSRQRYRCKECNFNFVEGDARTNEKIAAKKAMLILLYSLGKASFNLLARLFDTWPSQVYRWVVQEGLALPEQEVSGAIKEMEFDEMWHFVKEKKRVLTKECFNIFPLPVDVESRKKSHSQVHHA